MHRARTACSRSSPSAAVILGPVAACDVWGAYVAATAVPVCALFITACILWGVAVLQNDPWGAARYYAEAEKQEELADTQATELKVWSPV